MAPTLTIYTLDCFLQQDKILYYPKKKLKDGLLPSLTLKFCHFSGRFTIYFTGMFVKLGISI